jgi:prevent-host-death family protein
MSTQDAPAPGPVIANMHQAKTQLSRLIERALAGEEVIVARNGVPAVRLVPVGGDPATDLAPKERLLGQWAGQAWESPDAWSPEADAEVAELFFGKDRGL